MALVDEIQQRLELFALLRQLQDSTHLFADLLIILPSVGNEASGAILDALFGIGKITAAVFPQSVQRAVTKQAAKAV